MINLKGTQMSKIYIGVDGNYEIQDDGTIIQRVVKKIGENDTVKKIYTDVKKIPNPLDRVSVEYLVQVTNIYKFAGSN